MNGRGLLTALLLLCAPPLKAELVWHAMGSGGHQHGGPPAAAQGGPPAAAQGGPAAGGGRGGGARFHLQDDAGATVEFWRPDLTHETVTPKGGVVAPPATGLDNYHLLLARRESPELSELAVRYIARSGRPSGHSPGELVEMPKGALEIVPDPLPREHRRWVTGEEVSFRVLHERAPLPGARLTAETSHGSRFEVTADPQGLVRFTLPEDYPQVAAGRGANPPAELRLAVAHSAAGKRYHSTLTHEYHAAPHHWQSASAGLGVAALGFVAGIALTRRLRNGGPRRGGEA